MSADFIDDFSFSLISLILHFHFKLVIRSADKDLVQIVKRLIDANANSNHENSEGLTPLMLVMDKWHGARIENKHLNRYIDVANMLIAAGCDINHESSVWSVDRDYIGTALMRAIILNLTEMVKLLLDKGANPDMSCE